MDTVSYLSFHSSGMGDGVMEKGCAPLSSYGKGWFRGYQFLYQIHPSRLNRTKVNNILLQKALKAATVSWRDIFTEWEDRFYQAGRKDIFYFIPTE